MNARLDTRQARPDAVDEDRGVLRFITAGSVDDGKSTLIGRLLYDTRSVLSDQLAALSRAGTQRAVRTAAADAQVDLSLLTDGLEAEREQGITIDVAYRYFATARRKFIIADTPGHEQYTRNMVTGASTADAAVILIDATRVLERDSAVNLLPQTRRHSALVQLLGLRHVVVAVNKMDLVDAPQARFDAIVAAYRALADQLGLAEFSAIPVSALLGDNIVRRSARMDWYTGPTLLELLESIELARDSNVAAAPLRFAVQYVDKGEVRVGAAARRYLGRIGAGSLRVGDAVSILPAGTAAEVAAIETLDGDLEVAVTGQSVAVRLDRELDVARGDWLVPSQHVAQPKLARHVLVDLAWLDRAPLASQRRLWLRHGTSFVLARVRQVQAVLDIDTGQWSPVDGSGAPGALGPNDIGRVVLETQQPLAFDAFETVRASGALILVDAATHHTVAAGLLREAAA
ncbi:MAG: sulfate adenylyltransferase subunit 1 [Betaproteobacteria bacterium]